MARSASGGSNDGGLAQGARARILDAAESLFASHGFDGTATSAIAHKADVPKGLLFYYFPAKFDILSTLLTERLAHLKIDAGPLMVPGNPIKALLNVSDYLFDREAESGVLRMIVWREEHTHPEVGEALRAHTTMLRDTIERVLVGSLTVPAAARAVRAAARAWSAVVTSRPMSLRGEDDSDGQIDASAAVATPASRLSENLRSIAELICSGLQAPTGHVA